MKPERLETRFKSTRLLASLAPRVVLVAALCASAGLGLMYLVLTDDVAHLTLEMGADIAHQVMATETGLGCRPDPEHWTFTLANGSRVHAYDAATFRSRNPDSPPLDPEMVRTIQKGNPYAFEPLRGGEKARILFKVGESGPCSLLTVEWTPNPERLRKRRLTLLATMVLALIVTVILGIFWMVRPLLRRISALADTALTVGDVSRFSTVQPVSRDELGDIDRGLRAAHQRIVEDRETLKSKNLALTRHLSHIAHDLRTPITSLQLALERLATRDDEAERWLASALSDAVYLETLTDNLRLATKLQEGLVEPTTDQRADLVEVVNRVCSRMGLLARQRHISLESAHPDRPVWVRCDAVLAERALSNLVHNAIRYGQAEGHVAVLLEANAGGFTLEVLDDGPGVPPSEIPRLSERTFRGDDARQRSVQGTGIGLSITSEFCARSGLELSFAAVEPRGLRATISGPCEDGERD